jgi:hypothetical protein
MKLKIVVLVNLLLVLIRKNIEAESYMFRHSLKIEAISLEDKQLENIYTIYQKLQSSKMIQLQEIYILKGS